MKQVGIIILSFLTFSISYSQTIKKALFLGNSYTYYNDLPLLIENLANANSEDFIHDQNTPGGYQLNQHASNATTLNKIALEDWDYVIIQEQSQKPSFPPAQVATDVKPYAEILNDSIQANNSCSKTMFFMTWGRQNGDAQNCQFYTPLCTYEGMQGRLRESYLEMTVDNDADCAPVGVAWKKVREDFPAINLYTSDGSHPSIYGSYLAACVFYTSMFHKSTVGNTYWSTLDSLTAYRLQDIASSTVLDSLSTWSIETVATGYESNDSIITFCDSVEFLGDWYFSNTNFSDTVIGIGSCAEITNYDIQLGAEEIDSSITFCDSLELLGNWYFTDFSFSDTTSGIPCDLIINYNIKRLEPIVLDSVIFSCNPISINGFTHFNDTAFLDSTYTNACLTIYNYVLRIPKDAKINYFHEAIYVKTLNEYGYNFMLDVQNVDSIFLYLDSTLIATYPSLEENLTPSFCFIDCDQNIDGSGVKNFTLVVKNECSIDSLNTLASCTNFWGPINSIENTHWQISPNPTNNYLEIKTDALDSFMVSLMDISGKVLLESQNSNLKYAKLDVSLFEKGIYFLIIYDEDNTPIGQQKVVIN